MSNKRLSLGKAGEQLAAEQLVLKGYSILQRNYRTRAGEIDIIARQGKTLVFAEVKTRSTELFGSPAAAVTPRKQAQISRVAEEYLIRENLFDSPARFDVISILVPEGGQPRVEIIVNAFELNRSG